jgi:hypothetical protein
VKFIVNRLEKYAQSICVYTLVQNVTGDGASCAVSFWPNRSPGRTILMSSPNAEGPAKAKKPQGACDRVKISRSDGYRPLKLSSV